MRISIKASTKPVHIARMRMICCRVAAEFSSVFSVAADFVFDSGSKKLRICKTFTLQLYWASYMVGEEMTPIRHLMPQFEHAAVSFVELYTCVAPLRKRLGPAASLQLRIRDQKLFLTIPGRTGENIVISLT